MLFRSEEGETREDQQEWREVLEGARVGLQVAESQTMRYMRERKTYRRRGLVGKHEADFDDSSSARAHERESEELVHLSSTGQKSHTV